MREGNTRYEFILNLGEVNPVRYANSKEEAIKDLIEEYNFICGDLFTICKSDILNITEERIE
tara:strand:+ start:349 stop:534 length:186 start_codon:yes stop_codon:yes gene_type:complete